MSSSARVASTAKKPLVSARHLFAPTKLRPPQTKKSLVARGRLVDRLRAGRGRKLTLVCAPAGYGKTTLLAQWEAEDRARGRFVWLSLDSGDSDPVRLWRQIVVGLHMVHAPVGVSSLEPLEGGTTTISRVAIPSLLLELADAPPLVLILEDWHAITNALCDETMRVFVEHAPEALQIVISSRSDPGLPLARLRAHDEVAEVREQQLRFSPREAADLLRNADVDLGSQAVGALTARTEGWAAGLHLAALALQEHPDPSAFVERFSDGSRLVLDYLLEDVLDTVRPELRTFLVRSSVLERLSAPLCDAVLEISSSAELLSEVERANLFLTSLDDAGGLYRYHTLFASMLRRELALEDPELVRSLHARASTWLEAHGDIESAINHAIASRDLPRASDLLTREARDYWSSGQIATLTRWLSALDWPQAIADPQLALVRGTVLAMTGHPTASIERWLEVAASSPFERQPANGLASIEAGIALLRSLFLTRGPTVAAEAALRAIELEPPTSPWRWQALLGLGQALYLVGNAEEARPYLEDARRLPDAQTQPAGAAQVLAYLGFIELSVNRSRRAERYGREALALLEKHHIAASDVAANPHLAIGAALAVGADLHRAVEHIEEAVELSAPLSPHYWHAHALLRLGSARHRLGDWADAREAIDEARSELGALPEAAMLELLLSTTDEQLSGPSRRDGFLGEPLTESELRVLRVLAEGGSLPAAARALYLSVNTVKTHRRTIYRKLGATTREEALERATELRLLERV